MYDNSVSQMDRRKYLFLIITTPVTDRLAFDLSHSTNAFISVRPNVFTFDKKKNKPKFPVCTLLIYISLDIWFFP